jgi:hypothetical protein
MLPVSPVPTPRLALRRSPLSGFGIIAAHSVQTPWSRPDSRVPLPPSALVLGVAEDGLPVLLDTRAPSSRAILVASDAGAGKTALLRSIASSIRRFHDPDKVRFAVISEHPAEWSDAHAFMHCEGILAFHHAPTTRYLHSVVAGSSRIGVSAGHLFLLIDGFEALASDGDLRDSARLLLGAAAPSTVTLIVTLNSSESPMPAAWLDCFSVRILGYVQDRRAADCLQPGAQLLSTSLQPPCQFAAHHGGSWLPFWLPETQ